MADISVEQKKSQGGDYTWAWAAAAIVAIGGLMLWLFTSQETTTQVVTGAGAADTVAEEPATAAETVPLGTLGASLEQYVDQVVRVEDVPVTAVLGSRTFWADVPGANPLLVSVAPTVTDASWVAENATADLEGTVQPVTEEVVDQWIREGALLGEARVQATFATHYFQAAQVR
jgi:hypothetical protein